MPVFIAHRGNIHGAEPEFENRRDYMEEALSCGFGVECDVQIHNGALYFGHDEPQDQADYDFLRRPYVFCHAKTVETMVVLLNSGTHCFWHEKDQLTLTSQGFMWCYPGVYPVNQRAIWLDLEGAETPQIKDTDIFGVCGDNYANIKWNKNK
jgi:hypothetical protein